MKKFRLAIIIAVGGFLAFGVTQGASSQDYDGESLVKTRCSQCHNLGRVEALGAAGLDKAFPVIIWAGWKPPKK